MRTLPAFVVLLSLGCGSEVSRSAQPIGGGSSPSSNESVVFLTSTGGLTCTGTVVGTHHVLTVKPCIYEGATAVAPSSLRVFVGPEAATAEQMTVVEVIATPGPPEPGGMDDNALAVLVTAEPLGLPILPLAAVSPAVDDTLTIVGSGQTETGGTGQRREGTIIVSAVMDRVFLSEGPSGLCSGDSGPAIDAAGSVAGVGLFSFSLDGMSAPGCPAGSGFATVAPHAAWLSTALATLPSGPDAGVPDAGAPDDAGPVTGADAGGDAEPAGGCSCRAARSRGAPGPEWLVVLAILAIRRRRR